MTDQIDRAGAFQLGGVNLVSYASFDGDGTPKRLDIRNLIVEFNIYEDLNSPFLSGDMTLIDGTNAIQELPITGFERLEFLGDINFAIIHSPIYRKLLFHNLFFYQYEPLLC